MVMRQQNQCDFSDVLIRMVLGLSNRILTSVMMLAVPSRFIRLWCVKQCSLIPFPIQSQAILIRAVRGKIQSPFNLLLDNVDLVDRLRTQFNPSPAQV